MPEIVTRLVFASSDMLGQATQPAPGQQQAPPTSMLLMPLVLLGLVWYFLILRPRTAENKKRADLLSGIKKNDRVATIGGIIGTVVAVKDDEITLKVDESNNTKITFQRSAILRIIHADATPPAGDAPAKK